MVANKRAGGLGLIVLATLALAALAPTADAHVCGGRQVCGPCDDIADYHYGSDILAPDCYSVGTTGDDDGDAPAHPGPSLLLWLLRFLVPGAAA